MNHSMNCGTIKLLEWDVDYRAGRLIRDDEVRNVEPKVMDLLFLLASEPDHVFGRDEILGLLWPRVTVGEDALSRCVFKLRRALDDDPRNPRFIQTVPKRGYRFIAHSKRAGDQNETLKKRAEEFYFQFSQADRPILWFPKQCHCL